MEVIKQNYFYLKIKYLCFFFVESGLEAAQRITRAIFDKDLELLGNLHSDQLEEVYSEASKHHMEFIPGNITALNVAMKTGFFNTECKDLSFLGNKLDYF